MDTPIASSLVDEYIAGFPENIQAMLRQLRAIISEELPDAEEIISYQIPAFRYKGKVLVFFAGWKHHLSLYPIPQGDPEFQQAIEQYKKGRGTLQFSLKVPLPEKLIRQHVRHLVIERV